VEHLQPSLDDVGIGVVGSTLDGSGRESFTGDVVGNRQIHDGIGGDAGRSSQLVRALRLRERAREAVEHVATFAGGFGRRGAGHPQHEVVGNELTSAHVRRRLPAQLCSLRDVRPQQVAGGHVAHAEAIGERASLRALPRPGCAE
jgi:hypothetical protein